MDTSLAEEFEEVASIPLKSLPYGSPGQTFVLLAKPEGAVTLGKFGNVLKFKVKEVRYRASVSMIAEFFLLLSAFYMLF